jgi:uncharacterized protein
MPISQLGQVNLSALSVPQALVQIVPPQFLFGGVSSNVGGVVGSASWGPVGIPQYFGNYQQYASIFGPTINRKYDMGGHVLVASMQGAGYFVGVRVTDASDTAASVVILTNCLTITSKYTGTYGANIKATISAGAAANTKKIVISAPGQTAEIFDNVGAGLTANPLWVAIAAAINNGVSATRGPSALVVASAGVGVTATVNTTYSLAGGSDGVTGITGAGATTALVGVDTVPRTGMYALRGTPIARFDLCDLDDTTAWSTQLVFALDVGAECISTTPAGDTLTNAVTELTTAGVDSYGISVCFGDWIYFLDTINNIPRRLISPQALKLGLRGNLSPQNSSLNKPLGGIVGTQSSIQGKQYSYSDLQVLAAARLDVVTIDPTISNSFIFRLGINTSSSPVIMDDAYTDVTNFMAKSLLTIAAQYIGQTQTVDTRRRARVSLIEFLALAQTNGIIGTADGSQAYQVTLDNTNNTQSSVALGFMYAYVKAVYLGIVRYFIVNLEGGASVVISTNPPSA